MAVLSSTLTKEPRRRRTAQLHMRRRGVADRHLDRAAAFIDRADGEDVDALRVCCRIGNSCGFRSWPPAEIPICR